MRFVTVKFGDKSKLKEPRGTMVTVHNSFGYVTKPIEDVTEADTINGKRIAKVSK